jgi:hypothetical protein
MKHFFIFDLDGTLALTEHRQHLLLGGLPDKWRAFYAACDRDPPNRPLIAVLNALLHDGYRVEIWSGRSDEVRDKTEAWLRLHIPQLSTTNSLRMRKEGDHRPDTELKIEWWNLLMPETQLSCIAVFEDRMRMVEMWRALGVPCYQVAAGEF